MAVWGKYSIHHPSINRHNTINIYSVPLSPNHLSCNSDSSGLRVHTGSLRPCFGYRVQFRSFGTDSGRQPISTANGTLPSHLGASEEIFVDFSSALTPFFYSPDYKTLAPSTITATKDPSDIGVVLLNEASAEDKIEKDDSMKVERINSRSRVSECLTSDPA